MERCPFRIVQEALRNVDRHASAGRVTVRLFYVSGVAGVEVADDGDGFAVTPRGRLSAGEGHQRACDHEGARANGSLRVAVV